MLNLKKAKFPVALPKPKKYGVDLDGVCFGFLDAFGNWLKYEHNINIQPDKLSNYYWDDSMLPKETLRKIWGVYFHEFCKNGGILSLSPIKGSVNGLKLLRDMGNEIHFITSREVYTLDDTIKSIESKLLIPNPSVYLAKHGGKAPFVRDLQIDSFIEDAPHTIAEVAAGTRANVYCMDQPYNRHIDETFVTRVNDWQDFLVKEGWMNA